MRGRLLDARCGGLGAPFRRDALALEDVDSRKLSTQLLNSAIQSNRYS